METSKPKTTILTYSRTPQEVMTEPEKDTSKAGWPSTPATVAGDNRPSMLLAPQSTAG